MPKVRKVVNLLDDKSKLVTLHPGDEVPEWALARVTNPAVLAPDDDESEKTEDKSESTENTETESDEDDPVAEYMKLGGKELKALCEERGLDSKGNKPELAARLVEADTATAGDEVDVWELTEDELRELATERKIDIGDASTQVELATLIEQAETKE